MFRTHRRHQEREKKTYTNWEKSPANGWHSFEAWRDNKLNFSLPIPLTLLGYIPLPSPLTLLGDIPLNPSPHPLPMLFLPKWTSAAARGDGGCSRKAPYKNVLLVNSLLIGIFGEFITECSAFSRRLMLPKERANVKLLLLLIANK